MKKKMKFIYALVLFLAYAELFAQELPAEKKKVKAGISVMIYTDLDGEETNHWTPAIRAEFNNHAVSLGYLFILTQPKEIGLGIFYVDISVKELPATFAPIVNYRFYLFGKQKKFFTHLENDFHFRKYKLSFSSFYSKYNKTLEVRLLSNSIRYGFNVRIAGSYPNRQELYLSIDYGIGWNIFIVKQYPRELGDFTKSGFGLSLLKAGLNFTF